MSRFPTVSWSWSVFPPNRLVRVSGCGIVSLFVIVMSAPFLLFVVFPLLCRFPPRCFTFSAWSSPSPLRLAPLPFHRFPLLLLVVTPAPPPPRLALTPPCLAPAPSCHLTSHPPRLAPPPHLAPPRRFPLPPPRRFCFPLLVVPPFLCVISPTSLLSLFPPLVVVVSLLIFIVSGCCFILVGRISRPHLFGKGRGGNGCILASEGEVLSVEPTSLNREEGLVARWFRGLEGEWWWRRQRW